MDGFAGFDGIEDDLGLWPAFSTAALTARAPVESLIEHPLPTLNTLLITKLSPGLDDDCVASLRRIVEDVAAGRRGALKFLVLDFAHHVEGDSEGGEGFHRLVNEVANLILRAPIVAVACVRADLSGADLELALACSMVIAEDGRRFHFMGDPVVSLATYGFLSQKIGFVRAERLMERGDSVAAVQMHEMMLVKALLEPGSGFAGVEQFLARTARRHNSCYGIYRAQRIAAPALDDDLDAQIA